MSTAATDFDCAHYVPVVRPGLRTWFERAGFVEVDYLHQDAGSMPAVGVVRYVGEPRPLVAGRRIFTFIH